MSSFKNFTHSITITGKTRCVINVRRISNPDITSRGDGREKIYLIDNDRDVFLSISSLVYNKFNWQIHAYCLMSNHYHLLLKHPDPICRKGCHILMVSTRSVLICRYQIQDFSYIPGPPYSYEVLAIHDYESPSSARDDALKLANSSVGYGMKDLPPPAGLSKTSQNNTICAAKIRVDFK